MKKITVFDVDKQEKVDISPENIKQINYVIDKELELQRDKKQIRELESIKASFILYNDEVIRCFIFDNLKFYKFIKFLRVTVLIKADYDYICHLKNWNDLSTRLYNVLTIFFKTIGYNKMPETWDDIAKILPRKEFKDLKGVGELVFIEMEKFYKNNNIEWI